jgi:superfamily II DNA or RNA helicase
MALAYAAHLGVRTMIIVHKEFLANQWKERINQFCPGATIGRVQQDTFDIEHDFVIGMIQTMCSRENDPKAFDTIGFVIVDEAHHIGAAAFSQTMFKLCPRYSLGLTATPDRKDGLQTFCTGSWDRSFSGFNGKTRRRRVSRLYSLTIRCSVKRHQCLDLERLTWLVW